MTMTRAQTPTIQSKLQYIIINSWKSLRLTVSSLQHVPVSNHMLECVFSSPIDAYNPDYKKYPKFRQAKAISFTQEAGDLFIIPTGWFHQAYNPVETMAISSQVMNSQNYKLVLDEIYKGGEVDPRKLPRNFHSLSAREQVEAVVNIIPMKIIGKGKKVTEDILNQLKWKGKGKQHNK